MNVGMIGLGKLGLPVAYAIASRGLTVYGFDPHVSPPDLAAENDYEQTIEAADNRVVVCPNPAEVVTACDVIFVAVQTPHAPRFEGITPIPVDRADFDYGYLVDAVKDLVFAAEAQQKDVTLAVISTVLPGTMAREVEPLLGDRVRLVYTPQFIAMGTTIRDYLEPEFVLVGGDDDYTVSAVYGAIYGQDHGVRLYHTTVENAELIKVAYNTFIGLKIAFANTIMEVCEKTACDVDAVMGALKHADRRLISPAYLDGGMGDGGGCHPRDNIALSWLARKLDLSYDLFHCAMDAREAQTRWLCEMVKDYAENLDLPVGLLGVAYKPESALVTGSPALLAKHLLMDDGYHVTWGDPFAGGASLQEMFRTPRVFLIGCKHGGFEQLRFPEGSVVIDPFRYIADQSGVTVVRVGEGDA